MRCLLVQYTIVIILMLIFLKGYFPINYQEAPVINPPTEIENVPLNLNTFYKPLIKKLVLVIIDALRYDFITEANVPHLYTNMNCLLKTKVEAPTVTLPRIKALTTGAVPQFIDIVLNLGVKSKVADSFLHRAHAVGKKMVFYGDNTWLMMFPDLFLRSDGTTSFFVNDFTEVDDNVTRHINEELKSDWDIMILHYLGEKFKSRTCKYFQPSFTLGLDHIGHVRGPFSNLVQPKLHEMDNIMKKLLKAAALWQDETMIMITGDHGMKDTGGHGGTTYSETHVPLIVYHNKGINCRLHLTHTTSDGVVQQSDIANTMSALFGIAMPPNSIGKILPQLLTCDKTQLLYTLHYNSIILQRNAENVNNCKEKLEVARNFFKKMIINSHFQGTDEEIAESLFHQCLELLSSDLIQSSVKQNTILLMYAMFGSINCLLIIYYPFQASFKCYHTIVTILLLGVMFSSFTFSHYMSTLQLIVTLFAGILTVITVLLSKILNVAIKLTIYCQFAPFILHGALLFSSSYMEEEHYIFYYFICTTSVLIAIINYRKIKRVTLSTAMPLTVIEIVRLAREVEESKDWLLRDENVLCLKIFHSFALICTIIVLIKLENGLGSLCTITWLLFTFICIHLYKFYFDRSIAFARAVWTFIGIFFLLTCIKQCKGQMLFSWIAIMTFQLRPYNTLLVPAIILCSFVLNKSFLTLSNDVKNIPNCQVIIYVWLGYSFFFIQGHRNNIASIDLVPGYIGLNSYEPFLVGILTLCHSYGFQTLSLLLLFHYSTPSTNKNTIESYVKHDNAYQTWKIVFSYKLFILLFIYLVIYINQGHLFVWSVFAPKLLIECMHTFVLYLQILFYWIYTRLIFISKNIKMQELKQ